MRGIGMGLGRRTPGAGVLGGGEEAVPFAPTDITGLALWLKADAGLYQDSGGTTPAVADNDPVGLWQDQSGNTKNASQATADNRPTLKLNIRNGKPVVRLDGTNDFMSFASLALTDHTIYIAHRATDLSAGLAYILGGTGNGVYCGGVVANFNGYGSFDGTRIREAKVEPNTFGIVVWQNAALYRNGVEALYDNTETLTGLTLTRLGHRPDSTTNDYGGDIGEILIYNTVHDAATRKQVEAYLGTRWGVTNYVDGVDGTYLHTGPGIILTYDDGRANTWDGFQYMRARGMRATSYVITNLIGVDATALTVAQIQAMYAANWDIANHTTDHTVLTTLAEADQETKLAGAKAALDGWGLTRASAHVAYPQGGFNADTLTAMAATGMLTGRTTVTDAALDPATLVDFQIGVSLAITNTTTIADIQAAINTAVGAGQYCLLLLHGAPYGTAAAWEMTMANFEALIDWINAQNIPMLTITDLYALM